jgi:hypothetical protein
VNTPKAYLDALPPAISGSGGHNATLRAACALAKFGLSDTDALALLAEWNATHCRPRWDARELFHKWQSAKAKVGHVTRFAARPAPVRVPWIIARKTPSPTPAAPVVTAPAPVATKPAAKLTLTGDFFANFPTRPV